MNQGKLSCYILTFNSEKYLYRLLDSISNIVDDLLIVDSGSTDSTKDVAHRLKEFIPH
jgi:glycosyltransferase involved in cell wall biosynthesis